MNAKISPIAAIGIVASLVLIALVGVAISNHNADAQYHKVYTQAELQQMGEKAAAHHKAAIEAYFKAHPRQPLPGAPAQASQ
jgi:hypothetical protein